MQNALAKGLNLISGGARPRLAPMVAKSPAREILQGDFL